MSITNTKSIIINELWKWTDYKSRWGKYIVSKIIKKEEPLSNEERNIAFNLFLDSIGLENNDFSYNEKIQMPNMIFNPKGFKLLSIKDVKGVNKLAPNQELIFGGNITVIYGENGTGKSGYGRILKSLGVSYDEELEILSNVYNDNDKNEDQSAFINYEINKIKKKTIWEKDFSLDEFKSISFFNNRCVNISLNSERKLIGTPIGFYLLELVSEELNEISLLLKEYVSNLETDFDLLSQLNEGTDSYKLILQLDYKTKVEDIEKLVFLEKDENNLLEKKKNLKDLNKKLIENNIKSITKEVKELNKIKEKLEDIRNLNIKEIVNELKRSLEEESKLKNIKSNSLRDIIEEKNIKLFDSDEFINFIKSADDYIKKIGNESYPEDEEDICIYCRQKLKDKESIKLIKSYRKLLNDDKEIKLKRVQNRIKKIKDIIAKLDDELIFVNEAFGVDSKNEAIQPELMKEFNEHIKLIKELVFNNSLDELENYFDINELIELIDNKYKKKNEKLIELEEKIPEVENIEGKIQNEINELEDKKTIYQKKIK